MKIGFGLALHGWLPVRVAAAGSAVEFTASCIPDDPVPQLIDAACTAFHGRTASVWWHLEPAGYCFEFCPTPDALQFSLSYAQRIRSHSKTRLLEVAGSKRDMLLPIWRAVRQLQSLDVKESNWPAVHSDQLEKLGELLRADHGVQS